MRLWVAFLLATSCAAHHNAFHSSSALLQPEPQQTVAYAVPVQILPAQHAEPAQLYSAPASTIYTAPSPQIYTAPGPQIYTATIAPAPQVYAVTPAPQFAVHDVDVQSYSAPSYSVQTAPSYSVQTSYPPQTYSSSISSKSYSAPSYSSQTYAAPSYSYKDNSAQYTSSSYSSKGFSSQKYTSPSKSTQSYSASQYSQPATYVSTQYTSPIKTYTKTYSSPSLSQTSKTSFSPIKFESAPKYSAVQFKSPATQYASPAIGYTSGMNQYGSSTYVKPIAILRQSQDDSFDGGFSYEFQAENGIASSASGHVKQLSPKEQAQVIQGQYSYTAPDGTPVVTRWYADETGFHAEGSHLPVAPPVPEAIAKSLAYQGVTY